MIRVIRNDGQEILLNANMVQNLTPVENDGTVVRLKNQYKDIIQKIQAYRTGLYESQRQEDLDKKKAEEKES